MQTKTKRPKGKPKNRVVRKTGRKRTRKVPGDGHFWTGDPNGELLSQPPWYRVGPACRVIALGAPNPPAGAIPFWRFWDDNSGTHFWTLDPNGEYWGGTREGPAAYVFGSNIPGTIPFYRFYSDKSGVHFWTTDANGELLPKPEFHLEGPACYVYPSSVASDANIVPFWRFFQEELDYISFVVQHQQQGSWCWAAVAVSVSLYFNPSSTWTQCTLVNAAFGRTDCCINGSSSFCDRVWHLDRALTLTGNLAKYLSRAATFSEIKQEIDNKRPLCLRVGWSGGGGHFLAINGYNGGIHTIAVTDPWCGLSDIDENTLRNSYQGSGTWTHTYWVH